MEKVSLFTYALFTLSTAFVGYQLYQASQRSGLVLILLLAWAAVTGLLGWSGFYRQGFDMPPRFLLLVGPGIALTLLLLLTARGRVFLDKMDIPDLTLLQAVRIPVEITLWQLYGASLVPQIMTFEGRNFDILTGLSALLMYYLVLRRKTLGPTWLLAWNFLGLLLLFNIMAIAILSLETPFQRFGLEQPNVGVTYFPFVWLPGIIVPAALFSHLVSIRALLLTGKQGHTDQERKVFMPPPA
ncbi:MAG: hypothetical protein ACO1O1_06020 [Adhaeribacter sp.]